MSGSESLGVVQLLRHTLRWSGGGFTDFMMLYDNGGLGFIGFVPNCDKTPIMVYRLSNTISLARAIAYTTVYDKICTGF